MSEELRGVLSRRKGIFFSWTKFTYVKKGNYLFEYKLGANHISSEPLMTYEVDGSIIEDGHNITGNPASFVFHTSFGKSYFFLAPSLNEKKKWMEALSPKTAAPPPPPPLVPSSPPTVAAPAASVDSTSHKTSSNKSEPAPAYEEPDYLKLPLSELENKIPLLKFLESFTDAVVVGNIKYVLYNFSQTKNKKKQKKTKKKRKKNKEKKKMKTKMKK